MKVSLIDYTGKGMHHRYAAELLIFTKSTRLEMRPDLLDSIKEKDDEWIIDQLTYMANTIPSSWEFIHYTFMIEDCDRAFTHQLVRTRQGSYAQQTMRVLNVSGFEYNTGPTISEHNDRKEIYNECMENIDYCYKRLIESGAAIEDARGILPTNIRTNIVASFNLRTCAELISKRSSPRTQGEYRSFIDSMRSEILKVHPWFGMFLQNKKHFAAGILDDFIKEKATNEQEKMSMIKMVDMLRSQ